MKKTSNTVAESCYKNTIQSLTSGILGVLQAVLTSSTVEDLSPDLSDKRNEVLTCIPFFRFGQQSHHMECLIARSTPNATY